MALLTGLTAYYKLDESSGTVQDSVGSNNETSSNNKTPGVSGLIINAIDLSGTTSYVYIGGTFTGGSNARTMSCWIKADVTTGNRFMLSYGTDAPQQMFGITTFNTNRIWFTANSADDDSGVTFNTTDWFFCVFVYDGADQIGYVNGVEKTRRTVSLNTGTGNFTIGNYPAQTGVSWDGKIDEIGFWSRALTGAEITQLYNGGAGLQYPFTTTNSNFLAFM